MIRKSNERANKYIAKINGEYFKKRVEQLKRQMARNEKEWQKTAVKIEQEMKSFLDSINDKMFQVYYIVFAKEINRLMKTESGESLAQEIEILQQKWWRRGLNRDTLYSIKEYYLPTYENVLRFDIGRFDINAFG